MIQNFISKLDEKQKKIFYITVGVVALALIDRLFLGPVLDKIHNLNEEIVQQKDDIRRDLKFLSYSERIIKNSQTFGKYLSQSAKDDDVINAEFLSQIERLAHQTKVSLVKSNPSDVKKESNFAQYSVSLDCAGELKNIISFMHLINSSDELLKVTRFNMAAKRGTEGEVNSSMTVVKLIVPPDSVDKVQITSRK